MVIVSQNRHSDDQREPPTGTGHLTGNNHEGTARLVSHYGRHSSVSVVIPCYDQGCFLGDAIRSARSGTGAVEVLVVDNGSRDATAAVAAAFPGVRYIRQSNQGVAGARNRGLRESRGDFVVFLDADDCLLPNGIDIGAAALEAHPLCAMVFGRCILMAIDGTPLPTRRQPRFEAEPYAALLRYNPIWMPGCVMFRREWVVSAKGFTTDFHAASDYDLYLRLGASAPAYDHGEFVAMYRVHDRNMSADSVRMLREVDAVMRRNRPRTPHLVSAWQEGRRMRRRFFAQRLVREIHGDLLSRRRRDLLAKAITLMRWNPVLGILESPGILRTLLCQRGESTLQQ